MAYKKNGNWYNGYGQRISRPGAYFRAVRRNSSYISSGRTYYRKKRY